MESISQTVPFWRRALNWVLNPVILLIALGLELRSTWSLGGGTTKVATGLLGLATLVSVAWYLYTTFKIEKTIQEVERERDREWSPQIEKQRTQLRQALEATPASSWVRTPSTSSERGVSPSVAGRKTIYIRGVELENIRCFKSLGLTLEDNNGPYLTTILLGDNAAGKTTILRSIALGLCPESDAVSLMKTLPGSFLREGTTQGSILLHLRSADRRFEGSIRTKIEHPTSGGQEVIRQTTEPADFPWSRVFVCGYGTQRTSGRPSSHQRYSPREAVATLFSDSSDLLNPEVVLLRREPETRSRLDRMLKQILLLEDAESGIRTSDRGVELGGPWGTQPLSVVSDGYRSTLQWVLDYLGWQIFANRLNEPLEGILLIDELEQHLHPRWQRYFVQRLRAQLGETQMLASSHTPLLAAGVADVDRSQVVRLVPVASGSVETLKIPMEELTGKRADQILADAFGLVTSKSPGSIAKIDRYTELLSRTRSEPEEREFHAIKKELDDSWSSGDHAIKRAADKAVSKVLDEMIDGNQEGVDAHVKQRLLDLFGTKEQDQ